MRRERRESHLRQALGREPPLAPADGAQGWQARVRPHHDDLERREREDRVERVPLRHVSRWARAAVQPVGQLAGEHRDQPDEPAQQGALACTVGAEEGEELASLDGEREMLEDGAALVAEAHVAQGQQSARHQLPCTAFSIVCKS